MVEGVPNRAALVKRGRRLEYFTIAWNAVEGFVAVIAGVFAGSISLVGFGFDSFVEVTSGSALLWRMFADDDECRRERVEKITLRIVGICFIALATYVAYEAVSDLTHRKSPDRSIPGMVLACLSLIVMPLLSSAKRKVASSLRSPLWPLTPHRLSFALICLQFCSAA